MTLIVSWIGVDNKKSGPKTSSIYIATDSRISWGDQIRYDSGRKVFGIKNTPDIFGFCGDVLFPSTILHRIIDLGNLGILFSKNATFEHKFNTIKEQFDESLVHYPVTKTTGQFTILHASRADYYKFNCGVIKWKNGWSRTQTKILDLPKYSTVIYSNGSGKEEFDRNFLNWKNENHNNNRTSRAVYHCFMETMNSIKDKRCGGAPQLVGLYRIENSRYFGVVKDNKRYFLG